MKNIIFMWNLFIQFVLHAEYKHSRIPALIMVGFLFALVPCGLGQTTWAIEGVKPSYGEFNAPPIPCALLLPPYAVIPSPLPPLGCPTNMPFPSSVCEFAGSAFDNNGNAFSGGVPFPAMIHSDGITIEMTDAATGAYLGSMAIGGGALFPGILSGIGYDSLLDIIYVTDGLFMAGIGMVPCAVPPLTPPIFVPPVPLPVTPGSRATGLDWDPCTGTLWFCECPSGLVKNCTLTGGLIASFPVSPFLMTTLSGLDVNVTNGNLQVTDGMGLAEFTPAGILAAPGAFYLTSNPYLIPLWSAPVNGLGFSLRPQVYGRGCSPSGVFPSIGYTGGYPFAGNGSFTITQSGATPGAAAYLVYGTTPACPPIPITGCPGGAGIWVFPFVGVVALGPVSAAGTLSVPAPIPFPAPPPCGLPVGVPIFVEFINVITPVPLVIEYTDALSFTIGAL
jgi:hypothetical protein